VASRSEIRDEYINVNAENLRFTSDTALVVALGRWHQNALEEIYARHGGSVFALSSRIVNDRARAEDVTQEVFLKLWQQPDRFDPDRGSLRSYLLALTHGRSVDVVRSESARKRREDADTARIDLVIDGLEREVVDLAIAEQVKQALEALPQAERDPIELAYFGGHTYREAAVLLNQPEGTIKTRIRTGLRRLREALPHVMEDR